MSNESQGIFGKGAVVTFGTRVGSVHDYFPRGMGLHQGPHYEVVPFDTGVGDGFGYVSVYPASMVALAPLDWAPVLGSPNLLQRWQPQPGDPRKWERVLKRVDPMGVAGAQS